MGRSIILRADGTDAEQALDAIATLDREQVRGALVDRKLIGIPASPGIVVGPVHLLRWEVPDVRHRIIPDDAMPSGDRALPRRARSRAGAPAPVRERVERRAGPEEAAIFDVQLSILDDAGAHHGASKS